MESCRFIYQGPEVYKANRTADPPLSARGIEQAAALAAYFADSNASAHLGFHAPPVRKKVRFAGKCQSQRK
jgi:broad specificity phosphatase PhoE